MGSGVSIWIICAERGIMIVHVVGSFFVLGEVEVARDHFNFSVSKNTATGCLRQFLKMNVQEHLAFGTLSFPLTLHRL